MKIKIKKNHEDAVVPSYAHATDAGMDMTAVSVKVKFKGENLPNAYCENIDYIEYDTGLSFEIPEGYAGFMFCRSSVSKKDLSLCNSVGVVDSSYRGNVMFRFNTQSGTNSPRNKIYEVGDKIGQMIIMPVPRVEFDEVDCLEDSARGAGGFGSTGK